MIFFNEIQKMYELTWKKYFSTRIFKNKIIIFENDIFFIPQSIDVIRSFWHATLFCVDEMAMTKSTTWKKIKTVV